MLTRAPGVCSWSGMQREWSLGSRWDGIRVINREYVWCQGAGSRCVSSIYAFPHPPPLGPQSTRAHVARRPLQPGMQSCAPSSAGARRARGRGNRIGPQQAPNLHEASAHTIWARGGAPLVSTHGTRRAPPSQATGPGRSHMWAPSGAMPRTRAPGLWRAQHAACQRAAWLPAVDTHQAPGRGGGGE